MTWLEQFVANYEGKSSESKQLEQYLKENYQKNPYIPWATMERLTYMQDPSAQFVTHIGSDGTPLFSRQFTLDTTTKDQVTHAEFYTHFVRVGVTFLGKTIIEDYPVQDKAYDAPKVVDSNMVNKAIQRAKAKVASRVTGLALKLYESKDLQFDAPEDTPKALVQLPAAPTPKENTVVQETVKNAATVVIKETEVKPVVVAETVTAGGPTNTVAAPATTNAPVTTNSTNGYGQFIVENWEKLKNVLAIYNGTLKKKYNWQFDENMSIAELDQKINALPNPSYMMDQIKKKAGL